GGLLDNRAEVTFMGKPFPGRPGEGIAARRFARTLSNLGVGYLWLDDPSPPGDGWIPLKGGAGKTGWWYHTDQALPRVYTLDRLHPVGEMDALYQLTNQDDRELVVVEGSYQELSGIMGNYRWPLRRDLPDDRQNRMIERYFNELQGLNRIHGLDFTNPNRLAVEIEIRQPAMMVVGDYRHPFWRAEVDGETVSIYRVNYILRGVWLKEGTHRVEMAFTPWHMWGAYLIMALTLAVLATLFLRGRRRAEAAVD
nr:hypothetical protein [bacterium]